ncbi:MAG: nitronate monooxygenase [Gammaproteobacteria bacterium]|nr:nitronate monooxygenase [Gammaproteobacteria bacterium]
MKSALCDRFGMDFPLFAFSHCRDVVAAVTNAGGMGVFGAVAMTPERLEEELCWIDAHVGGKPYGLDLLIPDKVMGKHEAFDDEGLLRAITESHKQFTAKILTDHGVDASGLEAGLREYLPVARNLHPSGAADALAVAFRHPIKLIANALGVPPANMLEFGRQHQVAVAALVGAKEHAIRQVQAGVDIIIAAGGEAGGHCGDVSTLVLIPEVVDAIRGYREVPVLAAGGIVTGRQMAACMAMGAAGAWTASVWLTTPEAETHPVVKEKMLAATSRDTVRSRCRTGKPSRQLSSAWTRAWEDPAAPKALPMPLQSMLSAPALAKVDKLALTGHAGAKALTTYWVGQGVGLMNEARPVRAVMQAFQEDFLRAYERLSDFVAE